MKGSMVVVQITRSGRRHLPHHHRNGVDRSFQTLCQRAEDGNRTVPWEKQFDSDEALLRAMEAFWARGYAATSMQDLVTCMGINRGSLYDTFGDKRSLFLAALRRYDARHRADWLRALRRANGPKATILAAFDGAVEAALGRKGRRGCFLVNAALELSPYDKQVAAIVAEGFAETEAFFRETIEAAQTAREIPKRVDAGETARALLGLFIGLRVLARSRPEAPLLRSIAGQAATLLGVQLRG